MINRKIVMIPGPTPVTRSIQEAAGRETWAFGDPGFVKDYKGIIEDLKSLWRCDGQVFVVAGSGTLAMEMAIANNTKPGDNVLVISHGFFGDRFSDIARRKGLNVDLMQSEWGAIVPVAEIGKKLEEKQYAAVTATHVDTSTAVMAPIHEIGMAVKQKSPGAIYIVDGVAATAGIDEDMEKSGIDVLLTGSQKAFGVPPGLAMVFANSRSLARRAEAGETIPEYYVDYEKWLPVMDDPLKYFATPSVNLVWALKEALEIIKHEGLDNRYARHAKNGAAVAAALETLGFTILAEKPWRAPTLTTALYMDGVDDAKFRSVIQEEGVIVAGALGKYAGKAFRLGHMGNTDTHDLVCAIAAIERTLHRLNACVKLGSGVGALMERLV